jgi:hypothetical protein
MTLGKFIGHGDDAILVFKCSPNDQIVFIPGKIPKCIEIRLLAAEIYGLETYVVLFLSFEQPVVSGVVERLISKTAAAQDQANILYTM